MDDFRPRLGLDPSRIADCGCIVLADIKPIGYRFEVTQLGDVRVPVYACAEHDRTKAHRVVSKKKA